MITWKKHFIYQADYQHWANEVLLDSLSHLSDEARNNDEGLYFQSIHHTLDHILVVNRVWLGRLKGQAIKLPGGFNAITYPDWRDLKTQLQKECRQFQHWLEAKPDVFFEMSLKYQSMAGHDQENWVRDVLTHIFNHATHHRGQISAVATRLGAPVPEMDYLYYKRKVRDSLGGAE